MRGSQLAERHRPMRSSDQQFLRLNDDWALATDGLQVIVQRRWQDKLSGEDRWKPVSFVFSRRSVLERLLREAGLHRTKETRCALETLPVRFRKWLQAGGPACADRPVPVIEVVGLSQTTELQPDDGQGRS